jgi:hypothetical protein
MPQGIGGIFSSFPIGSFPTAIELILLHVGFQYTIFGVLTGSPISESFRFQLYGKMPGDSAIGFRE